MTSSKTMLLRAGLVLALVPLSGCVLFGDDTPSGTDTTQDDDAFTSGAAGASAWTFEEQDEGVAGTGGVSAVLPEPFSHELQTLIVQPVRWGSSDVSVTGARQVRGLSGPLAGTDAWGLPRELDPSQVYVELDLELTNRDTSEAVYSARDTWDVILANGDRLRPTDGITARILPGDSATASLHYRVASEVDLTGAQLELNGETRTSVEPERVPLDAPYVQHYPRRITSMVGQELLGDLAELVDIHIDEAIYDLQLERSGRVVNGKRIVWLRLSVAAHEYSVVDPDVIRIVVDGRAAAPFEADLDVLHADEHGSFLVAFAIDEAATSFDLVFPTDTPEGVRFTVNVADTVLATDIP